MCLGNDRDIIAAMVQLGVGVNGRQISVIFDGVLLYSGVLCVRFFPNLALFNLQLFLF